MISVFDRIVNKINDQWKDYGTIDTLKYLELDFNVIKSGEWSYYTQYEAEQITIVEIEGIIYEIGQSRSEPAEYGDEYYQGLCSIKVIGNNYD